MVINIPEFFKETWQANGLKWNYVFLLGALRDKNDGSEESRNKRREVIDQKLLSKGRDFYLALFDVWYDSDIR